MTMVEQIIINLKCRSDSLGGSYELRLVRGIVGREARYHVQFNGFDHDAVSIDCRRSIGAGYIEHWLAKLRLTRIPIILDERMGCDGAVYTMEFNRGINHASFTWWCAAPEEYQVLVELGNDLLREVGVRDRELSIENRACD